MQAVTLLIYSEPASTHWLIKLLVVDDVVLLSLVPLAKEMVYSPAQTVKELTTATNNSNSFFIKDEFMVN